jgi:hypothetical protein
MNDYGCFFGHFLAYYFPANFNKIELSIAILSANALFLSAKSGF